MKLKKQIFKQIFEEMENFSDNMDLRNSSLYMPLKTSTFKFGISNNL